MINPKAKPRKMTKVRAPRVPTCSSLLCLLCSPLSRTRLIQEGTVDGRSCVNGPTFAIVGSFVLFQRCLSGHLCPSVTERINLSSTPSPGSGDLGQCFHWSWVRDMRWEIWERTVNRAGLQEQDHHHLQLMPPCPRPQPRVWNLSPYILGLTFLELRLTQEGKDVENNV